MRKPPRPDNVIQLFGVAGWWIAGRVTDTVIWGLRRIG